VETKGLLNVLSAPQLGELSTSVAQQGWEPAAGWAADPAVAEQLKPHSLDGGAAKTAPLVVRATADGGATAGADEVPLTKGRLLYEPYNASSGARPRTISLADKAAVSRMNPAELPPELLGPAAFVSLAHVDVAPLVAAVGADSPALWDSAAAARDNAVLWGREGNMQRFKPGTQTAHLVFSDQAGQQCFHFPYWARWRPLALPVIQTVLGWYGVPAAEAESRIVRLQLARMGPGGAILKHSDKGGWATGLHRVHVPLVTNAGVRFLMQGHRDGSYVAVPVAPGDVFEINNAVPHEVRNSESEERVHLLLDWAEEGHKCGTLAKGQRCEYGNQLGIRGEGGGECKGI
jgi:hypothetical protein